MPSRAPAAWQHAALCALFVPLALFATWPLAANFSTHVLDVELLHGRFYLLSLADQYLVTWIHTWDSHALATDPTSLFHPNIFHPAPLSLARLDHHLGNALVFAPFYLASGNPVFAHNATVFAAYLLSAVAGYFSVFAWTRRADLALVAGALFAFAPWRLLEGNVQVQLTPYLPLIALFSHRVLSRGGRLAAAALFACLVLQSLCSVYLAAQAFLVFGAVLVAFCAVSSARSPRSAGRALLIALLAGVLLALIHLPYLLLKDVGEIPVSSTRMQELVSAAPLTSYVRFRDFEGGRYFLSLAALVLGGLGAASGGWLRRRAPDWLVCQRALLLLAALGFVLSLGPTLRVAGLELPLPYRLVTQIPGMGSMRGAFRFGIPVTLAASGLAALGLYRIGSALGRRGRLGLSFVALAALVAELSAHVFPLRPMVSDPTRVEAYRWLKGAESGPVLELPVGDLTKDFRANLWEARYTYFSHLHWRPLVNGYSSYPPRSHQLLTALARRLPDSSALRDFVALTDLRFVVVHEDDLPVSERAAWQVNEPAPGLERAARFGPHAIFRVRVSVPRALEALVAPDEARPLTLFGVSRAPLAPDAQRAALEDLEFTSPLVAGLSATARVAVENRGSHTWPGLDPDPNGLVVLRDEWIPVAGSTPVLRGTSRVAGDVAPGERVSVPFTLVVPKRAGRYRLRLTLAQQGVGDFPPSGGGALEVEVTVIAWPEATAPR